MKTEELRQYILTGGLDEKLTFLYGMDRLDSQRQRYLSVLKKCEELYGDAEVYLFSAPGRTEVGGNHTDHQLGCVFAASLSLDAVAAVVKNENGIISYHADGFHVSDVDTDDIGIHMEEKNMTESLIRGTVAGFRKNGYETGGFSCYADSEVLPGSGMSSSACFEVLLGTILNCLYNEGRIPSSEIAKIGQYAENVYFMKGCGLLDQMACSIGSFAFMDFANPENPYVEKIAFDPADYGYDLILTDVRASHADLSDEYSKVPAEMKSVAKVLGKEVLGQCTRQEIISGCKKIREACGDRAFLRSYHFIEETERAKAEAEALKEENMKSFLKLVRESGQSSWMYLQNVCIPGDPDHQALAVALALSESLLKEDGAWRVHGGGFAGTIQAFVPEEKTDEYISLMESVFGKDCCYRLSIRNCGGIQII